MTSNFTDAEWANIMRLLGSPTDEQLAVEILRGRVLGHEDDMYKAFFLLTADGVRSAYEGSSKPRVNVRWSMTVDLKKELLKLRPWLDVNTERIEHLKAPYRVTEPTVGCSFSSGHLHSPKARPAGKTPVRPAVPAAKAKPAKKVLGSVDSEATTGQYIKRIV